MDEVESTAQSAKQLETFNQQLNQDKECLASGEDNGYVYNKLYMLDQLENALVEVVLDWRHTTMQTSFLNKMDALRKIVETGNYNGAINKIVKDMIPYAKKNILNDDHRKSVLITLEITQWMLENPNQAITFDGLKDWLKGFCIWCKEQRDRIQLSPNHWEYQQCTKFLGITITCTTCFTQIINGVAIVTCQ